MVAFKAVWWAAILHRLWLALTFARQLLGVSVSHTLQVRGAREIGEEQRVKIIFKLLDNTRCVLFDGCPELGPESTCIAGGTSCVSADVTCDLCNVPGLCDDTALGLIFVDSKEECQQQCRLTPVIKNDIGNVCKLHQTIPGLPLLELRLF